jgi:hypothetical protein
MAMKQKSLDLVMMYRLKVTLKGSKPPIWRRLEVPGDVTLAKLHRILQVAMGWTNSHLHSFKIGGTYYQEPDPDFNPVFSHSEDKDEKRFKLQQVALREKMKFIYEYDFGDGWEHEILVEKIFPMTEERRQPVCIKGARACPPEDIGGMWGYYDFLEIMEDPEHSEHEGMLEWVGGNFDPEEFNLEEINKHLRKIKR